MAKIQSKLRGTDFGPKRLLGQPDGVADMFLGTLIGAASGITTGTTPQGDDYFGFTGAFEYVDSDAANAPKASGRLFLPEGIANMIRDAVETMKDDEKDTGIKANVRFVLKVGVQRAKNPAGYEWSFEPIGEIGVADPLSDLRKSLPAPAAAKAIEGKAKAA